MTNNLKAQIVLNDESFLQSNLKYLVLEKLIKLTQVGGGNLEY